MSVASPADLAAFKTRQRAIWSAGDYPGIDHRIAAIGEHVVELSEVSADDAVLDVACGAGNATIPAARRAGRAVGLDLVPALIEAGRARAAQAGVEVEWVEGDAEALPFADGEFDVVLSTLGVMFAPRHRVAAEEILRVLRPGGRFALAAWTPEGRIGEFFRTVSAHLPPPPAFAQPPPLWGSEEHVRELFAGLGVEPWFVRESVRFRYESIDAGVDEFGTKFGPVVTARGLLEPDGRWPELRSDLRALFERINDADDGSLRYDGEYLVALGRKPAA